MMNDEGKSDRPIVPGKPPNKAKTTAAEVVEGRGLAKENANQQNASRTQRRVQDAPSALDRVRQAARKDRKAKFTALLHHVTLERLREAFLSLERKAAPGVDGVTWKQYEQELERNLQDLHQRLHRGAYRARPSRRVYIPKADGRQRPLGVASLEDKIVQRAVVEVLNAIYEVDFLGFSYGFRPGRSQHNALDAIATGILRKKVNYVLDADIRGYFDAINHEWMLKFVEHRIADRRVLRLIRKWLSAGVMENGTWAQSKGGTPQGATVSPLLANIYLHYVLDLWVEQWRKRHARGDVIISRWADDFIVGFQVHAGTKKAPVLAGTASRYIALREPTACPAADGCPRGFHAVEPRGFLCANYMVILDASHPVIAAMQQHVKVAEGAFRCLFRCLSLPLRAESVGPNVAILDAASERFSKLLAKRHSRVCSGRQRTRIHGGLKT